jgi:tripartite-type tricarboxylate transporter receptor subunit TctC
MKRLCLLALAGLFLLPQNSAKAQDYPTKQINLIAP